MHRGFLSPAEDLDLSVIAVSLISEDESTLISSFYEGYFIFISDIFFPSF